jgi:DNA-binding transcriptional regulator YiaG
MAPTTARKASKKTARVPKRAPRRIAPLSAASAEITQEVRRGFGLTRAEFRRLSGFSERALANWESGKQAPDAPTTRRLVELNRLRLALSRVIDAAELPDWLGEPNPAFGGLKPLEVVERGEIDRLWRMVHEVTSGMPL